MNTKKIVAMVIALIMTTALFAGCGNSVDHKDSEVSSTVETTIDKDAKEESEDKKSETADKADATETADKKDSKETSNKAEKPNDNKVADKSDKDKGSVQANSNSSISKPNSGNANNNGSASKPNTPAKPNKPSSGNNSGSSNNGNHNGSVNKPSKPAEKPSEKPSEPETPAPHVCSFDIVVSTNPGNCQTASSTVKKCSCGKTTTVTGGFGSHNMVHHDAQGHEVIDYDEHYICNQCGMDFGDDDTAAAKHIIVTQGCQNYSLKQVPVGSHWEETSPAYDECSICGKR